jgi:hypothetical protein
MHNSFFDVMNNIIMLKNGKTHNNVGFEVFTAVVMKSSYSLGYDTE